MALVVVVCLAMTVAVLAAGLFTASTSQARSVRRHVQTEQTFYIAEAGIQAAAGVIYANKLKSAPSSGLLPGLENPVSFASGNFQVSSTSGPQNTIIVQSTGILNASERTIEAAFAIPEFDLIPANVDAALGYYGTNHALTLQGAGGKISGDDYDVPANFPCPGGAHCRGTLSARPSAPASVYSDNTLAVVGENLIEAPPPVQVQEGGGSLTEADWTNSVAQLIPLADLVVTSAVAAAGQWLIGTRDEPTITVVKSNGSLDITGNANGAGILILEEGALLVTGGTFQYEGLVIAFGSAGDQITSAGTPVILGAVVCLGENASIDMTGNAMIRYSSPALANLDNLKANQQPLSLVYWREIK